jgi:hypothetical protein
MRLTMFDEVAENASGVGGLTGKDALHPDALVAVERPSNRK